MKTCIRCARQYKPARNFPNQKFCSPRCRQSYENERKKVERAVARAQDTKPEPWMSFPEWVACRERRQLERYLDAIARR